MKVYAPIKNGFHLSPVYQLQPYDLALKGKFQVGIKYSKNLVEHSNLGIYYYDRKDQDWIYSPTKNNRRKLILTTELEKMDAVTIIQDLDSPIIKTTFPGDGGKYNIRDVIKISIQIDDYLSGIESIESSFDLLIDKIPVYPAYQPIKKIVSYNLDQPLNSGVHTINFKVRDKIGNESEKDIHFTVF